MKAIVSDSFALTREWCVNLQGARTTYCMDYPVHGTYSHVSKKAKPDIHINFGIRWARVKRGRIYISIGKQTVHGGIARAALLYALVKSEGFHYKGRYHRTGDDYHVEVSFVHLDVRYTVDGGDIVQIMRLYHTKLWASQNSETAMAYDRNYGMDQQVAGYFKKRQCISIREQGITRGTEEDHG